MEVLDLPSGVKEKPWYSKWISQCRLLLWKNYKISLRNRRGTIVQLIAPAVLVASLFLLQLAITSSDQFGDFYEVRKHQKEETIESIPLCHTGFDSKQCWTFLYAPIGDPDVESILKIVREQNSPPIPEDSVKGFNNAAEIDFFIYSHLNSTQGSYIFNVSQYSGALSNASRTLSYTIQVNQTDQFSHGASIRMSERVLVPMSYAIERAIVKHIANNDNCDYDVKLIKYPHPEVITVNIIGTNGPLWFFAAIMFNFVVGLGAVALEKELKLRAIMKIMGLYDSAYWFSWFITLSIYSTLTVLILITTGCIFQFNFFLKNAFGLYFFLLELFALSMVSMTFLISTLVKKAGQSTNVGFLVFIMGFFIQLGAAVIYSDDIPKIIRNLFSLFSPAVLQVGLYNLGVATQKESYPGMRWTDVSHADRTVTQVISFSSMYGWLILDFFLYLILALYLDNVLPNVYGTKRPFYYFLQPSYWTGKSVPKTEFKKNPKGKQEVELNELDDDVLAERDAVLNGKLPGNTAVEIKQLTKIYNGNSEKKTWKERLLCCFAPNANQQYLAVNELCLSIQSDTLLCLLGPNGAGKTTSIHMMVGFHEATSGDAMIYGNSITQGLTEVQRIMGVCPQFDILWPELTGEEHLHLFAGLRNLEKMAILDEAERLLREVELTDSKHMRSASYSGGMKRRLSVAISMIGNPKIVFLDEPTTGMDPINRRKVWNIIERAKKDKVIVLTTHSMEEADILGDKIAIMAKGQLQCVGSSLRLKQKFGAGYRIAVGAEEEKVDQVVDFFTNNLSGCKLQGAVISGYMNFTVPRSATPELVPFFKQLQPISNELGIKDLQLSLTTLEEVFLNIAEAAEAKELAQSISDSGKKKKKNKNGDLEDSPKSNTISPEEQNDDSIDLESQRSDRKKKLKIQRKDQFKALFIKTATLQSRDKKTVICQCLTPLFLVLILFALQKLIIALIDPDPISEVPIGVTTPPFHLFTIGDGDKLSNAPSHLFQNLQDGAKLVYTADPGINVGSYALGTGLFGNILPVYNQTFPHKFLEFSQYGNIYNETFKKPNLDLPLNFVEFPNRDEMDNRLFSVFEEPPQYPGGYYLKTLDPVNDIYSWAVYYNHSISFALDVPAIMNRMTNAIVSQYKNVSVVFEGIREMPTQRNDNGVDIDITTLAGAFFYMLILNQLFPVFMSNIVYEKESKIMEMMNMMGLKSEIYWVVQYLFNFILYLGVIIFLIIAGFIFRFRFFTINAFGSYFILFLLWGNVLIAMAFFFSTFFSSRRVALIVGYFYVLAITLICGVLLENLIGDVEKAKPSLRLGLSVIPPFALYRGLIYLAAEVYGKGPGYSMDKLDIDIVNMAQVYGCLIIEWVVIMLLWAYLRQVVPSGWGVKKHPLFFLGLGKHSSKLDLEANSDVELPADVAAEMDRVFQQKENKGIRVLNLQKTYPGIDGNPPKVAVKGVSFGVDPKSCLGVLGHNGAGKTTTIHMLIGLIPPSGGTAYVGGKNLNDELDAIYTFMGICPQHDILWDALTGAEHMLFYGRIKGLRGRELDEAVANGLKSVNLFHVRNKQAQKYSGGMKRRLSVAIALIGRPKVIYLDEPSTGLDPKSRQDLWQVINDAKQYSSVILTTHSMEEADAICDRLMIMSEGEIKCIGPSADLKNRFGEGYKLSFQVARGEDDTPADQFIRNRIPSATLINELAGTRNYSVPKKAVTLDKVFAMMEENKESLKITDWAIANATLEEVFIQISMGEKGHEATPASSAVSSARSSFEKKKEFESGSSSGESSSEEQA